MSEQDPELEAFSKFIATLDPWLGEVVLVGGWAHRLYRLDSRARKLDYLPLTTLDGDVAVPPKLKKEESTVRKRLLEAGFEEEFPKLHARRVAELEGAPEKLFGKVEDTIREAALMAAGRKLSPERLAETAQAGLKEIFGRKAA
jgi:hypothetical protein